MGLSDVDPDVAFILESNDVNVEVVWGIMAIIRPDGIVVPFRQTYNNSAGNEQTS